jgi:hypothetical protein
MTRRALIIRSGYDPPPGTHNAAECIGQVLRARGFELEPCEGPAATRSGILAAYDDLIERAHADDAIVIYYAGHGGLATNSSYTPGSPLPPHVQHICPTDFADTRDDDFHGISALELSLKLVALTARTANATVILECCFAAQMSRAMRVDAKPDDAPVVTPKLTRVGLTRHLEEVRARARALGVRPGAVSPHAVRVAASGQTELARPVTLPSDEALASLGVTSSRHDPWIGALTLGLVQILAEIGDTRVPWRSIGPALRERLLVQRPEIEGPIARVPFSLATVDDASFGVRLDGDGAIIEAGRLLGVSVGDIYRVVPAGVLRDDTAALIATLTIDEVFATRARASRVEWANGHRELPLHSAAIATSLAPARYPVRIVAPDHARDAVVNAVCASPRLRAAIEADRLDVLGELRVTGDQLEVSDQFGPLFPPAGYPDRLADAVLDLANLATERRLRALPEDGGIAPSSVTLELGRIQPTGAFLPIARHGEPAGLGDSFVLRLENMTDAPLYANVFNIGLRRRIALLSDAWASGVQLMPSKPVYVGDTTSGELRGFGLQWPTGLPREQPRPDTVMVMITAEPADLRVLESRSHLVRSRSALSPLAMLANLAPGVPRGSMELARYGIMWRDWLLFPIDGSLEFGVPEVDASPPRAGALRATGTATLRIRCEAIERWPDATRLDVLVVARSSGRPVRATTYLPGESIEPEVWRDEAHGAVDVYAFTSTAGADRRSLAELLRAQPVDDAIAMLRAPDGDPRVELATAASLMLAGMARRALAQVDAAVATAFRGSFATDSIGAVRYRASAVAFTLAVEAIRP